MEKISTSKSEYIIAIPSEFLISDNLISFVQCGTAKLCSA